jgi:uncharacterized protein with HEPN domain
LKTVKPFLKHIIDEIDYLLRDAKRLTYDDFIRNETLKRSFVRSLEVIGEATKNLPSGFRSSNPDVPWKEMAGLRDILIHQFIANPQSAIRNPKSTRSPLAPDPPSKK